MDRQLPWEKMNQFMLQCGLQRDSRGLAETALRKLSALIPFDQGRLYFLNSQGQVCDYRLLGVDKSTVRNYLAYHSQLDDGAFSLPCRIRHHQTPFPTVCDWSQMDHSREFYQECVRPQKLTYCTGLMLHDAYGSIRALFCLDRTRQTNYSLTELETLYYLTIQLDNLHQNLFVKSPDDMPGTSENASLPDQTGILTKREQEVFSLLLKGISPDSISRRLCISINTTNKHISHIYQKFHVSSRQELLVKAFSKNS